MVGQVGAEPLPWEQVPPMSPLDAATASKHYNFMQCTKLVLLHNLIQLYALSFFFLQDIYSKQHIII